MLQASCLEVANRLNKPLSNPVVSGPESLPSIIVHQHLAYFLVRLAIEINASEFSLTVDARESKMIVSCVFHGDLPIQVMSIEYLGVKSAAQFLAYTLELVDDYSIKLTTDFEDCSNRAEVLYSVES